MIAEYTGGAGDRNYYRDARLLETLRRNLQTPFFTATSMLRLSYEGNVVRCKQAGKTLAVIPCFFNFQERKFEASKVIALFDDKLIRFTSY